MDASSTTDRYNEISKMLEPLIRRIIRKELERFTQENVPIFKMNPEMPIYKDMEDISQRKARKQIELYSDDEVWDE